MGNILNYMREAQIGSLASMDRLYSVEEVRLVRKDNVVR